MAATQLEKATFAGGCFWCMVHPFDEIPGMVSVTSGYTGGQKKNPTYKEVSAGGTGHAESLLLLFMWLSHQFKFLYSDANDLKALIKYLDSSRKK